MKKTMKRVFSLALTLAMMVTIALPMSVSAAPAGEVIDLDNFTNDTWNGGNGTNWSHSVVTIYNRHVFTISGDVTVIGTADSLWQVTTFDIVNPDATVTWKASLNCGASSNAGVNALIVSGSGKFEMTDGSIVAVNKTSNENGGATSLMITDNVTANIQNGNLSATANGTTHALRNNANSIVLLNDAVNYTGNLVNQSINSALIVYTPGSYNAGDNNGTERIIPELDNGSITHEWATENGISGITVKFPEQSRFIPITTGVTVSAGNIINLDNFDGSETWNGGQGNNWTYEFVGSNPATYQHTFFIRGGVTVVGTANLSHRISFDMRNSNALLTWNASYKRIPFSSGGAISVGNNGRFEMIGGVIETNTTSALTIGSNVTAVISNGTLISNADTSHTPQSVSAHSNAVVLVSNEVTYNAALNANTFNKAIILTYVNGSYNKGASTGIELTSHGSAAVGTTYKWENENGISGISVDIPDDGNKFIPITTGVTVSPSATNNTTGNASITINRAANSNISLSGKTFYAYKVFDVTSDALSGYNYTITDEFKTFNNYPNSATVGLREYISGLTGNSTEMNVLAANLWDYIEGNNIQPTGSQTAASSDSVKISDLPHGYYLLFGSAMAGSVNIVAALSLTTADSDIVITLKADAPWIAKHVWNQETSGWTAWGNAKMGETINYRLTSAVPEMIGYEAYVYMVHENLSAGLSFNSDSIVVKVNGATVNAGTDYTVNINPVDNNAFTITFVPAVFVNYNPGNPIEITYSADLNQNAVIGAPGNTSETVLEFSNNPVETGTAQTAKHIVTVYTFDLNIYKYTGTFGGNDTALANAEFELRTDPSNPATAIDFVLGTSGNGTLATVYRHAAPTEAGKTKTLITPTSGKINLIGLEPGTYYLVETKAPAGFNLLSQPITVVIAHTDGNGSTGLVVNGAVANPQVVNVQNNAGTILPETGGMGSKIFILVGFLLMATATALFLIRTKRRLKSAAN